jgi:biopolymer transport protein ExbD
VLLIIFMVAAPLRKHEEDVRVPKLPPPTMEPAKPDMIVVDIDPDHTIRLNNLRVTFEELGPKLVLIFNARANKNMFLRGDPRLAYGEMFRVLDLAKRSGAVDIALLGATESPPASAASGPAPVPGR